ERWARPGRFRPGPERITWRRDRTRDGEQPAGAQQRAPEPAPEGTLPRPGPAAPQPDPGPRRHHHGPAAARVGGLDRLAARGSVAGAADHLRVRGRVRDPGRDRT